MKKAFIICLFAGAAFAGERWLGQINVRGNSANNLSVYAQNDGGFPTYPNQDADAGVIDSGFIISEMAKVTVQCSNPDAGSANAFVSVDVLATDAGQGLRITGNQALPTSVGSAKATAPSNQRTAVISVFSTENNNCQVWERNGREF